MSAAGAGGQEDENMLTAVIVIFGAVVVNAVFLAGVAISEAGKAGDRGEASSGLLR